MNRAFAWLGVAVALCAPWPMSAVPATSTGALSAVHPGKQHSDPGFEANRGQADARVRFIARLRDMDVYLTSDGPVLSMFAAGRDARRREPDAVALRLRFVDANVASRIDGTDALSGRVSYLLGREAAEQNVDIPVFRRVRYRDVYPGVDVVYYGRDGKLEFDLEIAPGVDPGVVRLRFDGADGLVLDDGGDLIIRTPLGDVVQHRPVMYQAIAGERREVRGGYALTRGARDVLFVVDAFDPRHALVLDPTLVAASMVGGSGVETSAAVAADASGNWYFAGHTTTTGSGFPTTVGAYQTSNAGSTDVFVRKVSSDGSTLVYSTLIGGGALDTARGLAVGPTGIAYVVGQTASTNFPTQNALQPTKPSAGADPAGFVTALNASGTALVYSTYLGGATAIGPATTDVRDIAVDADGNAYVAGETNTSDLPTSATAFQASSLGQFSAFVFKFDAAGARRFGTYIVDDDNGFGTDRASKIAIDAQRNVYIAGQANAAFADDYNGLAPARIGPGGGTDVLVARLNHTGEWLDWVVLAGGTALDSGAALDIDAGGRLVLGARSLSTDLAPSTAHSANWVWLAQLEASVGTFVDSRWLGGSASTSNIFARDLVWDGSRAVVVGDAQHPSTLPAIDPIAAIDCGAACGTSATTGGFICSYTSDPLAEESCTRVVATGGTGAGGVRYTGVAQLPQSATATPDATTNSAMLASAQRKAVAGHSDGTHPATTNTTGTTQQLVQAFMDFVFGPRPPIPPIVRKYFDDYQVKPGEITKVTIIVTNPANNPATITDLAMQDHLPDCLEFMGFDQNTAEGVGGLHATSPAPGQSAIPLSLSRPIPPGDSGFAEIHVRARPPGGPCTNTTTPATTNAGTAAAALAEITITANPCTVGTTGLFTSGNMSDAALWTGGVRPTNGCDAEIVPCAGAGTCTITNDQPPGEKIDVLTVRDEAFSLIGGTGYFVGGIEVPLGGAASFATRVESVDDEFAVDVAGNATFSGSVALKGASLLDSGSGIIHYMGGIEGTGDLLIFAGTTRISTVAPLFGGSFAGYGGTLMTSVPIVQPIALSGSATLAGEGPYFRVDLTDLATWTTSNGSIATVNNSRLTVANNARVVVDAGATGTVHDTIAVAGPVVLNGGTIELNALATFTDGTSYPVITGTSGITGCFNGAQTNVPGVAASVTCTASTVTVTVDVQPDPIFANGFQDPAP